MAETVEREFAHRAFHGVSGAEVVRALTSDASGWRKPRTRSEPPHPSPAAPKGGKNKRRKKRLGPGRGPDTSIGDDLPVYRLEP